ncbi:hypothetical protein MNB_SUP05-SYMBIONT-5-1364 [hydrothermal vent metagenome]|uniref:Uncharacterized protein n=1 Tax=hydrothermal vent metagenome TaxID=652676 RepID=A0A1W1E3P7_9ZZZZ
MVLLGRGTANSPNNSTNSSTPPSKDQNRLKPTRQKSDHLIGGVFGVLSKIFDVFLEGV